MARGRSVGPALPALLWMARGRWVGLGPALPALVWMARGRSVGPALPASQPIVGRSVPHFAISEKIALRRLELLALRAHCIPANSRSVGQPAGEMLRQMCLLYSFLTKNVSFFEAYTYNTITVVTLL